MCTILHVLLCVTEDRRGQRTADYFHFKMKEKLNTDVKGEQGLILFFLLPPISGLRESSHVEKKNLVWYVCV